MQFIVRGGVGEDDEVGFSAAACLLTPAFCRVLTLFTKSVMTASLSQCHGAVVHSPIGRYRVPSLAATTEFSR